MVLTTLYSIYNYYQTHPGTKVEDLNDHQTAKHYIEWVAKGVQPQCLEDDDPSVGPMMLAWKDTSAMYLREKHAAPGRDD